MNAEGTDSTEIKTIKDFVKDGRIDDAVKIIALYLGDSKHDDFIERLENIIETLLAIHGGRTVLRFLIENLIIDIPSLLENLSKRDSTLRYTFLLLLKTMCENEYELFLPYSEDLLKSDDPNVREADLQLIIFMVGGETLIEDESLIKSIVLKLSDEKDFVIEKAVQALKAIGQKSPTMVTKILTENAKNLADIPENNELKNYIDDILKSIVSIDKIEEIVEEEKSKISKEKFETGEPSTEEIVIEFLVKEKAEIETKEMELKKKEIDLKKKKLELEEKEKKFEEKEIIEKEKVLKVKEELLEKEKELSQVELEIKSKILEEKEQKILEQEAKRIEERLKEIDKHEKERK